MLTPPLGGSLFLQSKNRWGMQALRLKKNYSILQYISWNILLFAKDRNPPPNIIA
jgi:hypothetical protein